HRRTARRSGTFRTARNPGTRASAGQRGHVPAIGCDPMMFGRTGVAMGVLDGKGAVVTGGSRGIGRAIVRRLAADGAAVVFSFVQDQAAADRVAGEVADA